MIKFFCIILLSLSFSLNAAIRTDYVAIVGKISKTTADFVYLEGRQGKKSVVPIEKLTKAQLQSKKEITVYLTRVELVVLLSKIKNQKLL